MRWLALALLAGCSLNRSAEREDSFAQQGESRREEGPVRVTTTEEEFVVAAPRAAGTEPGEGSVEPTNPHDPRGANGTASQSGQPQVIRRTITVTERAPVVVSSRSQTEASGEAKEARSARFGFAPWQWVIGGLVALAGLYGLFRLKGRLGL